jgi:hypothetical protein
VGRNARRKDHPAITLCEQPMISTRRLSGIYNQSYDPNQLPGQLASAVPLSADTV